MTKDKPITYNSRKAAASAAREVGGSVYRAGDKWGVLVPDREWLC